MNDEDPTNIIYTCNKCSDKMYPRKGRFLRVEINLATHVKAGFKDEGRTEHMWVKIEVVGEDYIIGTLDNDPVLVKNLKCDDRVSVDFADIEDLFINEERGEIGG